MSDKILWEEITKRYRNEWVELVDYIWKDGEPYPTAGIVRVHAEDRKEFYRNANQNRPEDSAILFVGDINLSFGVIGNKLTQFSEFK